MKQELKDWILQVFFPDVIWQKKLLEQHKNELQDKLTELHSYITTTKLEKKELQELLNVQLVETISPIDKFCSTHFKEVPKFAYKDKRMYNGKLYPVYPNEMITPDSYYAVKLRQELSPLPQNTKERALAIGRRIDRAIRWVSDEETTGIPDFYHHIAESIIDGRSDCESHCFAVCSIDPETFGVAFGNTQKDKKGTWHAFNVFEHNNELWILETNSVVNWSNAGNTWIKKASECNYHINEIFTSNRTYSLDPRNKFGIVVR